MLHLQDVRGRSLSDNPEFDLKQARFEVRKFGIKGFEGDKKEEAMTSLLIRLGAKVIMLIHPCNVYIVKTGVYRGMWRTK